MLRWRFFFSHGYSQDEQYGSKTLKSHQLLALKTEYANIDIGQKKKKKNFLSSFFTYGKQY